MANPKQHNPTGYDDICCSFMLRGNCSEESPCSKAHRFCTLNNLTLWTATQAGEISSGTVEKVLESIGIIDAKLYLFKQGPVIRFSSVEERLRAEEALTNSLPDNPTCDCLLKLVAKPEVPQIVPERPSSPISGSPASSVTSATQPNAAAAGRTSPPPPPSTSAGLGQQGRDPPTLGNLDATGLAGFLNQLNGTSGQSEHLPPSALLPSNLFSTSSVPPSVGPSAAPGAPAAPAAAGSSASSNDPSGAGENPLRPSRIEREVCNNVDEVLSCFDDSASGCQDEPLDASDRNRLKSLICHMSSSQMQVLLMEMLMDTSLCLPLARQLALSERLDYAMGRQSRADREEVLPEPEIYAFQEEGLEHLGQPPELPDMAEIVRAANPAPFNEPQQAESPPGGNPPLHSSVREMMRQVRDQAFQEAESKGIDQSKAGR